MSGARRAFAAAAESLVGTPFRLHGRDVGRGLDCVGLVVVALKLIGRGAPAVQGYGIRNLEYESFLAVLDPAGFVPIKGPLATGELVIVRPGPAQLHLLVAAHSGGFVHAHAGLGRVVATPGPLAWPHIGRWQLGQD